MKFLLLLFLLFPSPTSKTVKVVLTYDDLPFNGKIPVGVVRPALMNKMMEEFKRQGIRGVYGFINAKKLTPSNGGMEVLKSWIKAGHYLGNHTFSHRSLNHHFKSHQGYIEDIMANEKILSQLATPGAFRFFRYPYLQEGNTQEKRDGVRNFLKETGYQLAPATINFSDWAYNDSYIRCLESGDQESQLWLRRKYLHESLDHLHGSRHLSYFLLGREISFIAVLHPFFFNVEMLEEFLTAWKRFDVEFIPLREALEDEIYQMNPNLVTDSPSTLLNQIRKARGLEYPVEVAKVYEGFPKKDLENICRI